MNSLQVALFVASTVTAVIANAYWYRAKVLLRRRGYPSSYFTDHLSDFDYMAQLIETEADLPLRHTFIRLRTQIKMSLLVTLGLFSGFVLASVFAAL